jgi:hypothetical protein
MSSLLESLIESLVEQELEVSEAAVSPGQAGKEGLALFVDKEKGQVFTLVDIGTFFSFV